MTKQERMEERRENVLHICWKIFNHRQAAKERRGIYKADQESAAKFWLGELDKVLTANEAAASLASGWGAKHIVRVKIARS